MILTQFPRLSRARCRLRLLILGSAPTFLTAAEPPLQDIARLGEPLDKVVNYPALSVWPGTQPPR